MNTPPRTPVKIAGKPIDIARAALINAMCEPDGVLITSRGTVELHRNGARFATLMFDSPIDCEVWKTFCMETGSPS